MASEETEIFLGEDWDSDFMAVGAESTEVTYLKNIHKKVCNVDRSSLVCICKNYKVL